MAFFQSFVSHQLLFLFSKHLDTSNVDSTDCVSGQTDLWLILTIRPCLPYLDELDWYHFKRQYQS